MPMFLCFPSITSMIHGKIHVGVFHQWGPPNHGSSPEKNPPSSILWKPPWCKSLGFPLGCDVQRSCTAQVCGHRLASSVSYFCSSPKLSGFEQSQRGKNIRKKKTGGILMNQPGFNGECGGVHSHGGTPRVLWFIREKTHP